MSAGSDGSSRRHEPSAVRKQKDRQRLAAVAIVFEEYASCGRLRVPREFNQLRGELWEIKVGDIRFPCYELRGDNHPVMVTRLTGAFTKGTRKTPRRELDRASWVMKEDKQA